MTSRSKDKGVTLRRAFNFIPAIEPLETRLPLSGVQALPVVGSTAIGPTIGIVPGSPTQIIQPTTTDLSPGEGAPLPTTTTPTPVGSFPSQGTTTQLA